MVRLLDSTPDMPRSTRHEHFISYMTFLANAMLTTGHVPPSLKCALVCPIFKNRPNTTRSSPDAHRPISVLPQLVRVFQMLVHMRAQDYTDKFIPFLDNIGGCVRGRRAEDLLFTVSESIAHCRQRSLKVYGCALDVKAAFDVVWRDGLLYKLYKEFGMSGPFLRLIAAFHTDTSAAIRAYSLLSEAFDTTCTVLQGSKLASYLYNVFMSGLVEELKRSGLGLYINGVFFGAQTYCDDLYLQGTRKDIQAMLVIAEAYSRRWNFLTLTLTRRSVL